MRASSAFATSTPTRSLRLSTEVSSRYRDLARVELSYPITEMSAGTASPRALMAPKRAQGHGVVGGEDGRGVRIVVQQPARRGVAVLLGRAALLPHDPRFGTGLAEPGTETRAPVGGGAAGSGKVADPACGPSSRRWLGRHSAATVVVVGNQVRAGRHTIAPPGHYGRNPRPGQHGRAGLCRDHQPVNVHGKQPVGSFLDAVLPGRESASITW